MMHKRIPLVAAAIWLLATGPVLAHGDEDHSEPAVASAPAPQAPDAAGSIGNGDPARGQRLPDGSVFLPKAVQRQLGIRTTPVHLGALTASVALNGKVISSPDAGGRVQATQTGSVLPGPKGMPLPGRRVRRGEVLAWLRPAASGIERANQQAQLAELEAQLAMATARLSRYEQLAGAIAQKEVDAARSDHAALQKRHAFINASVNAAEPLRAPVSGVISAGSVVAGQVVEAREILFEIIDPERLAVEALAYDATLASAIVGASALADDGTALTLKFIGGGRQLREQALPLLFAIGTRAPSVAVGQPVRVVVSTARAITGAALPRQALSKAGAEVTTVWVHSEAERFVPRQVRVQPLDAERVAIVAGLHEGDRVVSEGAGLLAQVR